MNLINVYHFSNGTSGGVLSVIKNIMHYSVNPSIRQHIIYTINKNLVKDYVLPKLDGVASEQVFYYRPQWNFYYTCKKLAAYIPNEKAILITHDWLELGMISILGLQNKVVTFLHGDYDYYYQLANLHHEAIDRYIAIASQIAQQLQDQLPHKAEQILYRRFPVPEASSNKMLRSKNNIIFVGRRVVSKGFNLLPEIDALLCKRNIKLHWHIVGEGAMEEEIYKNWMASNRVQLYGELPNHDVIELLPQMNYYILPSVAEGMPVSLVEAMKAGVIPLVNDIAGGIQELVLQKVTGFKIVHNEPFLYSDYIHQLQEDKIAVNTMRQRCIAMANHLFNPNHNAGLIEADLIALSQSASMPKSPVRTYGSRLDQPWIPNVITRTIRNCSNHSNRRPGA
jgi:glycosyltransferase involved in cell wall biosynthesis